MIIQTTRFGEIDVPQECMLRFIMGLAGFPRLKKYAFFPYKEGSPFFILQAVSDPDLTFLLVDPYRFFNEYVFELDDDLAEQLKLSADNPPETFCVVTMRESLEQMTINLRAPIIISWQEQLALQFVLNESPYSSRQRLFVGGLPGKKKKSDHRINISQPLQPLTETQEAI